MSILEEALPEAPLITEWSKDLRAAARTLTPSEVRYLVDAYYAVQDYRIQANNQVRAMRESGEPNAVVNFLAGETALLERRIQSALQAFANAHPVGEWLLSVYGIGPVIAAGLLAHIDITQAPTVGHIWSFAGLNPSASWDRGQKRPWNARLKVLCWKAGQSFMKFHNREECRYGKFYEDRKEYETARNDRGDNAQIAAWLLAEKKFGRDTQARKWLEDGKLPPGQIDARARRYAVKLFLAHLHDVWYRQHYGIAPPKPYAISILGHAHEIRPE